MASDGEALARIYNHYISNTIVTFEETPVDAADMAGRFAEVSASGLPWIVAEWNGVAVGYAYASKWKKRPGYRFSVESTVYLAPSAIGRGLGRQLYEQLMHLLEQQPIHLVIGGIALPNEASVALHERMGFEKVAHFREVGLKFGRWIDVGYWQRMLAVQI
jgi:phosphinothricin acetyltransferase